MEKENFGYRTTALETLAGIDLTGKNAMVTGGYSGIGLETARALATAGANVTIACRDLPRAQETANNLNQQLGVERVAALRLSLDAQKSVKQCAADFLHQHNKLHILVNNAAVMACPFSTTDDGFEMQFGTNHLGHFALVQHLLPVLKNAEHARVVCLSSTGHLISPVVFDDIAFEHRAYDPWQSYGQAKTANALTAVAVQQNYSSHGIESFAVHPGAIMTTLQRHMSAEEVQSRGWVDKDGNVNERFKTTEQGASTSTWAATSAYLAGRGGQYLEDCAEAEVRQEVPESWTGVMHYAVDKDNAARLWELSLGLIDPYL